MKVLMFLFCTFSLAFCEPTWLNALEKEYQKRTAVGMAEMYFPSHVQEKVAMMRARAKLIKKIQPSTAKSDPTNFPELFIKDTYIDKEGNLYLWVSLP